MTEKKHFGFKALYEAEQQKIKAQEERAQAQPSPQPETSPVTPKVDVHTAESGRPVKLWTSTTGRPQSPENETKWTSTKETADPRSEERSDKSGRPHYSNYGRPQNANFPKVDVHKPDDRHTKRKMTVRYSPAMEEQIKEFCARHKLQLQDFHEMAVAHFMEHVDVHNQQSKDVHNDSSVDARTSTHVDAKTSHDDLKIIYKTDDNIIMLYKNYSGREKWSAGDDRAAARFNKIDRRLIEIGMIHTVINARGKKINSFAYFIPEIQTMIDVHMDNQQLDVYLRSRRERLAKILKKNKSE